MCTESEHRGKIETAITTSEVTQLLPESHEQNAGQPISEPTSALQGYLFMFASACCYSLVVFLIHISETRYKFPTNSALIVRAVTSLTLSTIYLSASGLLDQSKLRRVECVRLCLRGIVGSITTVLSFGAAARIPVGTVVTVMYVSPAITSIMSAIFLNDVFNLRLAGILAINFVGIALVSQPSLTATDVQAGVGIAMALIAAFMSSTVFVLQRAMGMQVHFMLGVFAYGAGCAIVSLVISDMRALTEFRDNGMGLGFAIVSGLAGFGSQTCLNRGLQLSPAGPAIVVRSSTVPISFALGLVFLKEVPGAWSRLGVALVLASVVAIGFIKLFFKQQGDVDDRKSSVTKV